MFFLGIEMLFVINEFRSKDFTVIEIKIHDNTILFKTTGLRS